VPAVNTSRRQLLQWFGAMTLAGLPVGCGPVVAPSPTWLFLTEAEAALWGALADTIWPATAAAPGGAALGASRYLDRLLGAFEGDAPLFWADAEGATPIALDPSLEQAFRLQLYGSAIVPYPNEAVLGPVVGLRDQVRDGLRQAAQTLGPDFASRSTADRFVAWNQLPEAFRELTLELVCEALWSIPAYGGNDGERGWQTIHLEGRGQPTGYSLWDDGLGGYRERPGFPVSTADPGPDPDPMTDDTRALLDTVARALGGTIAP
jgi:hypothetical protein